MANTPMQSVIQSDTDNAPTTAPVVITPLSYFTNNAIGVLTAQLDGAESRKVFGQTIVVLPENLLDATSEQLEEVVMAKAKAILFGSLTLSNGDVMSVEAASKWYATTIQRGNDMAKDYAKEVFYTDLAVVKERYADFVNFNELNADGGLNAKLCLVSKSDYAKAEEIQAFFADNCLNLSRGVYLERGTGSIWSIAKQGIILS